MPRDDTTISTTPTRGRHLGVGDVVGPLSVADDALVTFDGTSGKFLQDVSIGAVGLSLIHASLVRTFLTFVSAGGGAVNYFKMANHITGNGPILTVDGSDTDVDLQIYGKNAGVLTLGAAGGTIEVQENVVPDSDGGVDIGTSALRFGKGWFSDGVRSKVVTDNVSSAPTDAELEAAFGTPAAVGAGFVGFVDDNGAGSAVYLCASDGTNWWYAAMTKAT